MVPYPSFEHPLIYQKGLSAKPDRVPTRLDIRMGREHIGLLRSVAATRLSDGYNKEHDANSLDQSLRLHYLLPPEMNGLRHLSAGRLNSLKSKACAGKIGKDRIVNT